MHLHLRFSLVLITLLSFLRLGSAQTVDTIFGCDEIPNTPLAGAACTICNFDILYGTTFPFSASPDAGWCGSVENDQYIGFVAGPTGSVVFSMQTFGCINGNGVQVGIYDQSNSLVGDCFNQVFPGTPQIFTASGLTPGTVYYMRIDGFAGDGCEFNIQVISGLISAGPDAPGPIMGPEQVCWDESYPYAIAPVPNATGYYWRLTPGIWTLGTTIDPPEATNPLVGTTALGIEVEIPPMSLGMPPGTCDIIRLEVFPLNPCFVSSDSSVFDIRVCRPTQDTTYGEICIGGEFEFPPGSGEFFSTPYTFETVELDPGPSGCDTFGVLYLEQVLGGINPDVQNVVLCEGDVANICGFPDPAITTGPSFCELEGAAYNGCDSIIYYNVLFLDPEAHIEAESGAISCTNLDETLWAVTRTGAIPPSTAGDSISYVWTDATTGVIGNDESVVVTEPGTYTLTVEMTSHLDPTVVCTETTDITIADNRTAPNPPALNGLSPVCANNLPQDYTATGAMGTDQYLWSVTPISGVTYSVGTDILTITDFGTETTAIVCVSTFNSCDTSTATCLPITVLPLPTPATLPALDTLCEGDNATYPIGGYDSNLTYTISSSPSGSSASVSGSDIDFTMGTASGQLCLEVSNTCETLDPVCMDIELRELPVAVAPTGATDVCVGQVETYTLYTSLPFGTTASASVTGGTIQSQSGNMATIEWTAAGTGQVCVTYTNSCGTDQACLDVTVTTAGDAVMSGGGDYCEGNNDTEITITFTGIGPYDYTYLHNTTTVTGSSSSSPVVITAPAPGTYVLTGFTVGACAGTVSGDATVTENPTPTAALSGGDDVCPGEDVDLTLDFTGVGPWTYEIALDATGQGTATTTDNPATITVSAPGTYTLVSVESDAGCVGTVSGSAAVTNLDFPIAGTTSYVCSPDGTTYTVSFPISGGDAASYNVAPAGSGTLTGSVFTSNPILSGNAYTFTVTDANDCDESVVTGMETCPCVTMIGVLDNSSVSICDDGTATDFSVYYSTTGEVLDPNDIRIYVLHTGSANMIVDVIATNTTGIFPFDPATMTSGTTYYVSVVVGNADGTGGVDLGNVCTIVAPGVPVSWFGIPTATLVGGGDVCAGADSTVLVNFTGAAPFTISYTVGTDVFNETTSDNPYTINLTNLQADVTVTLTSVSSSGCPGPASGTATFVVHDQVQIVAETACNSTSTEFVVTITITGGDPSSYTVTPSTGTLSGNVFTSDPIAAGSGYNFTVSDQWGCNTEVATEPIVICNCISDAGTMDQTQITMCGPNDISVVMPTDTMMDSDDVINFVLHDGSGNSLGTVITQQAGTTFSFVPGTTQYGVVYYISSVMGNSVGGLTDLTDICLDVAVGTPVMWLEEPSATLNGGGDYCIGDQIDLLFDVTSVGPVVVEYTDGTTTYTANLSAGSTTVPAPLGTTATYTLVSVTEGPCTGTVSGTAVVVVHDAPVVGNPVITYNSTSTEYQVTFTISLGDTASYTVDATPLGGATTFTSGWIACGLDYTFVIDDQYSCDPTTISSPVNCDCLTALGTISGNFASCDPTEVATIAYDATGENLDGDDAVEYILHAGDVNTPIARSASPMFAFDPGTMTLGTTYYVTVVAGNAVGGTVDLLDACTLFNGPVELVWSDPPTATLSGDWLVCPGVATTLTFDITGPGSITVEYTDGTTTYTEVFTAGSNSIPTPTANVATYMITSVSSTACPGTFSGSASVDYLDGPQVGTPTIEFNPTFTQYRVTFSISMGDTATYTVDSNPLGGATDFTSAWINCGTDYSFVINDAGGCDPQTIASPVNCDCRTAVGSLTGDLATCDLADVASPVYDATNENLDGDDAVEYLLYLTDVNTPIQRSSTPNFSFDPGTMTTGTTYFIVAVAGNSTAGTVDLNDPCLVISAPVTAAWYDEPSVTATAPTAICANEDWIVTINVTGTPDPKTVYYTLNAVQDSITGVVPGTASMLTFPGLTNSSITITGVADVDCAGSASIQLDVTVASEIFVNLIDDDNCDATGTEYFVTFEITGGDPSTYQVSPAGSGTITGNVFTSNIIASGTPYDFQVTDASGCFTIPVNGNRRCDCTTDAGQMTSTAMLLVCDGEDLSAGFTIGSEILDGNDQLLFALRTSGDRLDYTDDLLALNTTPVFPYDPAIMQAGDTLYISPVAGDATGATIDTSDPCLSIGLATPIYIEHVPTGTLVGDTIICEGGSAEITLVLTGSGPFDVTITRGDTGGDTTLTGVNNGYIYEVDPVTGTVYVMNNITMNSLPQCSATPNSRVGIDVDDLLTAGDETAALILCEGTGDVIQLADQINNEDVGGSWTQTTGPSAGGNFNIGSGTVSNNSLDPGVYSFTYTVGSGAPCPQDAADVDVEIEAGPVVDAGPDQSITCDQPVVDLGAASIPGYTYTWTGGTVADSTSSQTTTGNAGTFTLIVSTGTAACEGSDDVVVESAGDLPTFDNMLVRDVTCFGDTDGAVFTGVDGGTGPYNYTLDGGPTRLSGQFTNLTPGIHVLSVEDSEGCLYTENFIVEDAKEVVVDPGPNVEIPFGGNHLVELYLEGAIESVRWQGDSLECLSVGPICDRAMLYPQYSETYRVTARDSNGCTASAPLQLIVRRDRPVGVPTGFSPNGDGTNDLVWIHAQEGVLQEVTSFMIFDRWGEQVFATGVHQPNSPAFGWDGFLNGEIMNPQVFVYFAEIVYADGEKEVIKGDISLIR